MFNEYVLWLLLTYTLGTFIGWYFSLKSKSMIEVEAVIDSLIDQGFLKTKGAGENLEILKWQEWCDDQATRKDF
jgi:hypothetical protein